MQSEQTNVNISLIIVRSCIVLITATPLFAVDKTQAKVDCGYLTLDRIIDSDEFDSKSYGPIRWLEDGSGYTTLEETQAAGEEDSKDNESKDIVRYDPETG